MTFFKISGTSSSKNMTASTATTPLNTPRTSIHLASSEAPAIKRNNGAMDSAALEKLLQKSSMGHSQAMVISRV
ncbi:hypothetical protein BG000_010638 [Podila horticola]|nr:hypothetical protein BG003_005291 [Podila horticola]KAG0331730.1 hypothetical protein BG000_010638 [Podila horticola]